MISTRSVTHDADGLTMVGHPAVPDGAGRGPAVLLGHGGAEHSCTYPHEHPSPGVRAHPRHAARAWAAMLALLRETVG